MMGSGTMDWTSRLLNRGRDVGRASRAGDCRPRERRRILRRTYSMLAVGIHGGFGGLTSRERRSYLGC